MEATRTGPAAQVTAPESEVQPPPPATNRWLVLAVMSVGTLLVFLDDTVVNTALPQISVELDASTSALQWVVDAYVLVLAGLLLLCGSIGDRYGRKRIMSAGLVTFGIGAAGAALAGNTEVLIAMRGVQGLGAAMVLPATLSIIVTVFPRAERGKAIAIWTAIGGLGASAGPVLGGWLVEHVSWSAAFWLFIPLVIAALAGMVIVPESRDDRPIGLDFPGAVLGTAAISALVFGVIRGGETSWGNDVVVVALALAAVLFVAFIAVERRVAAPMLPLRFFAQRDFAGATILIGVLLFAMFVTFFFLTQFFQLVQDRGALEAGALILPATGGIIVGSGLAGKLMHTSGPRSLAVAMAVAGFTGLLLLTRIDTGSSAIEVAIPLAVIGLGGGLGLPALTDTVMAAVPERDAGVGSAVNDVSRQLGGALGVAVIGSVVNQQYRDNLAGRVPDSVPADAAETAGESIGLAEHVAAELPADVAAAFTEAADTAFTDAITFGFGVSAIVMIIGTAVAILLPRRMRTHQAAAAED